MWEGGTNGSPSFALYERNTAMVTTRQVTDPIRIGLFMTELPWVLMAAAASRVGAGWVAAAARAAGAAVPGSQVAGSQVAGWRAAGPGWLGARAAQRGRAAGHAVACDRRP